MQTTHKCTFSLLPSNKSLIDSLCKRTTKKRSNESELCFFTAGFVLILDTQFLQHRLCFTIFKTARIQRKIKTKLFIYAIEENSLKSLNRDQEQWTHRTVLLSVSFMFWFFALYWSVCRVINMLNIHINSDSAEQGFCCVFMFQYFCQVSEHRVDHQHKHARLQTLLVTVIKY